MCTTKIWKLYHVCCEILVKCGRPTNQFTARHGAVVAHFLTHVVNEHGDVVYPLTPRLTSLWFVNLEKIQPPSQLITALSPENNTLHRIQYNEPMLKRGTNAGNRSCVSLPRPQLQVAENYLYYLSTNICKS